MTWAGYVRYAAQAFTTFMFVDTCHDLERELTPIFVHHGLACLEVVVWLDESFCYNRFFRVVFYWFSS